MTTLFFSYTKLFYSFNCFINCTISILFGSVFSGQSHECGVADDWQSWNSNEKFLFLTANSLENFYFLFSFSSLLVLKVFQLEINAVRKGNLSHFGKITVWNDWNGFVKKIGLYGGRSKTWFFFCWNNHHYSKL